MSTENRQDPLAKVETERRDFLKKIAIAAAFAAPTIATFSLDGMRKKAFAQAAYDAPTVLSVEPDPAGGQAVVTFSQPMNTGVGGDLVRGVDVCREVAWESAFTYSTITSVTWSGNMYQVIKWTNCVSDYLLVTYNKPGCGAAKFVGENGQELKSYADRIPVNDPPC